MENSVATSSPIYTTITYMGVFGMKMNIVYGLIAVAIISTVPIMISGGSSP